MKKMLLLVAILALVASACGDGAEGAGGVASLDGSVQLDGSTLDPASGSTDVPEISEEEALLEFTACLREAGVDIDDPTVDAEGNLRIARPNAGVGADGADGANVDREAFQTARESCSQFLDGVALGFRDTDRTAIEDQMLDYAACMRENGFAMDDPDFSNSTPGAQGGGPFGSIDRDDSTFVTAQEACQDLLPGFGPGGGRGPGGGDN